MTVQDTTAFTSTVMDITPDVAAKWLEGNVRNRKIDQRHVDRLAEEIKAGHWKTTHQGIAFDTAGVLQDGQHRLWAVLQADRPVRMMVSVNVPPENIDALDGGKGRTVADRMSLSDTFGKHGITHQEIATLRAVLKGLKLAHRVSFSKLSELMASHREAVKFAMRLLSGHHRGIGVSYVRAVIARAWYSADREKLESFCRMLTTGVTESPDDAVIVRLRDQLMEVNEVRGIKVQQELYGKVERALLAWIDHENLIALRPVSQEHFPLPEEVKP